MRCRPRASFAHAAPSTAKLSASVAPLVNTISAGLAPRADAITSRDRSTAARASCPNWWMLLALPNCSVKNGSIASTTRGSVGVVAP